MTAGAVTRQLSHLAGKLGELRQREVARIGGLFATLGPRLTAARRVEHELNRALAARFNPLDYLRTDELGLSRIVADLLNPSAAHGQGTAFLSAFLERVRDVLPREHLPNLDHSHVVTRCERLIDNRRRLDVSVEICAADAKPICLAIENKPYAADGDGQVDAYLNFLRGRYPDRFLLIYLSPHGGLPSLESLPTDANAEGLATLAYCPATDVGPDRETVKQLPFALTEWLHECATACDVDRLRWFLRDTEKFCHKQFGGIVTTDRERQEVRDFVLSSEENLLAAFAVKDAYPSIRNEVIEGFLERLRCRVAQDIGQNDLSFEYSFTDKWKDDGLWAWREDWWSDLATPIIWLGHDSPNASQWWLGIGFTPLDSKDPRIDELREPLEAELGPSSGRATNFPWWRYLDEHKDWAPLLVKLHKEREQPGELIEHFATEFAGLVHKALDVIDSKCTST